MESFTLIALASIISASLCVALTSFACAFSEGSIANKAIESMAQQPDEMGGIAKNLFISMSMVESASIYGLLIAMILIFSNPFWNFAIQNIK